MSEFALVIYGVFREIRRYTDRPPNIAHKGVEWFPVVRRYGETEFTGIEGDNWVIQTIDPATLPPQVPASVTAAQIRLFLEQAGMLADVEAKIASMSKAVQIEWEYRTDFRRNSPLLNEVAETFNLTSEQIDQFFIAAAQL